MIILELRNISKRFGGYCAVTEVSFSVKEGELLALVGPNGAGKTTLFNIITGLYGPTSGEVLWRNEEIGHLKLHQRAARGIIRTFQQTKLFSSLTIQENILMGCHLQEKGGVRRTVFGYSRDERRAIEDRMDNIMVFTGLADKKDKTAGDLSFGDQRILEIGIALGGDPSLLLLDEPMAGMNTTETKKCMDLVRRIGEKGVTVLIIDHDMSAIMSNCPRVIVLDHGEKIAEGQPAEILKNPAVIESYLGTGFHA